MITEHRVGTDRSGMDGAFIRHTKRLKGVASLSISLLMFAPLCTIARNVLLPQR
ncbi:hypothetical protein HMPREF9134_01376 [Porphyromonas catoniae F0037]|uniref:Uncharacterized protein n=1 Tax=Porphyromonas catoniae F0037 TaxID=1127696 RepID=L1NAT5_9PORP|nr:hypothetical protein HMPREF9134_01376 [Porphyromonas catoniae F0037]